MLQGRNIRVVIIDDDEDDYFILSDFINEIEGSSFSIEWCHNYSRGIQKIKSGEYDIFFVDYRLGNRTGLDLLREVNAEHMDTPIVLLTGKGSKDIDIKAMQYGATDYLIKAELSVEKMERCIRYSLDRAENLKELRSSERKYRNLFENSKDAVLITNERFEVLELNESALHLFGGTVRGAKRQLFDLIQGDSTRRRLQQLLEREMTIQDFELEVLNREQELRSCLLSVTFSEEQDGSRLLHVILHDITNIKKADQANLHAEKLAANERLMRTLAHEIRNPLNNIGLSVEYFKLPMTDDARNQNLISIVQRNTIRINHIITELLNLTNRSEEQNFRRHTLQEIMDESIAMTLDRINLLKVQLVKKYAPGPLEISADKSKLTIAFTNILINAIEAMESGKGQLTIVLDNLPNNYLVQIRDNGKGIPRESISSLFEPFFTLKKNGTGLGLASCYAIVKSHRGNIRVESELNKGTDFFIDFERVS